MRKINYNKINTLVLILMVLFISSNTFAKRPRILIFSKTAGFKHGSIPRGIIEIKKLGAQNKFDVDTTTNVKDFNIDFLKKYKAVVFLNPTGSVFNEEQKAAFKTYIQSGGGFVGVHSATDFEYNWKWYGNLVGAYFNGHPDQQVATIRVVDGKHIATKHLINPWVRKDEWYNFKTVSKSIIVLLEVDESTYNAGKNKMGSSHPIAWYHDFEGGRSFYTGLGHTDESYDEPLFQQHLLGGILYAAKISKR